MEAGDWSDVTAAFNTVRDGLLSLDYLAEIVISLLCYYYRNH